VIVRCAATNHQPAGASPLFSTNPKSEARNPKEIPNVKSEMQRADSEILNFVLWISFGLRGC
jgi:hypothetical protein